MKYNGITIIKNKTCSTWYARYRLNGKQNYVSGKTQKQVYNKLKEIFKKETVQKVMVLHTWYNTWIDTYKKDKVKAVTINDYNVSYKTLSDQIKKTDINNIKQIDIEKELNNIPEPRSKQKLYELLSQLFGKAYQNEYIKSNPMAKIDKPKYTRDRGQVLSREQYLLVEDYCLQNNYSCILFLLYQGCRIGEALALTIADIDMDNKTMTINKSFNQKNEFDDTKNKQSIRTVPIFDKSMKLIDTKSKDRIFAYSQKQLQGQFGKIKKACGLADNFRIYDLRHTFISLCKDENIPEHIIQFWVGHEIGSKVTSRTYTHVSQDANLLYYNKLNDSKFYSNSTHFLTENKNDKE